MTQTSFLLSGISSNKAAVGDAKGAVSQDVTEIEGEGFFSKLSQLVAGDAETVDGKKDAALEGGESEEALNEMLTSALKPEETEGAENLALEGEEIDADGEISTGSEVKADKTALSEDAALSLKAASPDAESGTAERQLAAKQDGEAWLQRLNEANSVLKPQAEPTLDAETVVPNTDGKALVGKSLPSDQSGKDLLSTESLNASVLTASSSQDALPLTSVEPASVEEVKAVLASEGIDVSTLSTAELETIAKMAVVQDVTEQQLSSSSPEQQAIDAAAVRAIAINNNGSERPDATGAELVAGSAEAGRVLSNAAIAQAATVTPDTKEADLLAKAGAETLTKPQQDALMRAQLAVQAAGMGTDKADVADMQMRGFAAQSQSAQNGLSQAASAVQAAVNPQLQQQTTASAFAAIPWTPAGMQNNAEPQAAASAAVLEAATALQMTEASQAKPEVKAEHLAQQLATSFGNTSSTTAARLDNAVTQTPLQLSQNQAEAANALSERVNMMMSKNLKHVDIRLDPPELGRMQIKLSMNQDQASVQFTVANQAARDMVEQTLPRLREMMQQQGLQLAQSSVQQQDAGGRQAFAGSQSQQGDGQNGQGGQDGSSRFGRNDGEHEIETSSINRELYVNTSKDRVDYYA